MSRVGAFPRRRRPERSRLSAKARRRLLCECAYKCSVVTCARRDHLEFHHINWERNDDDEANILVLCREHHHLADRPGRGLSLKTCLCLKKAIRHLYVQGFSREALQSRWIGLRQRRPNAPRTTKAFVTFVSDLLSHIPGLVPLSESVEPAATSGRLYDNQLRDRFLKKLGPAVLVECIVGGRGHLSRAPVVELLWDVLVGRWSAGFLFSLSPFSPDAVSVAWNVSGRKLAIVLVGPEDVGDLTIAEGRTERLRRLARQFLG